MDKYVDKRTRKELADDVFQESGSFDTYMNKLELLLEMPIGKFELKGEWGDNDKKRGYDDKSQKIIKNPKAVAKIRKQWSKTNIDFDMYFLRSKEGYKYPNRDRGASVTEEYVKNDLGLTDFVQDDENTTIIYTSNIGDGKVPMTGWILAHRFGHAIRDNQTYEWGEFEKAVYRAAKTFLSAYGITPTSSFLGDPYYSEVFQAMGTMASARKKKLKRPYEFLFELFTQWLLSGDMYGSVKLRRDIPQHFKGRQRIMSDEEWDDEAYGIETNISSELYSVLYHGVGRIYVM